MFKTILLCVSLCGLIYQVHITYDQYMSDTTVFNLKIEKIKEESPPAITICYPELFSMERAGIFQPKYFDLNKRYRQLLKIDLVGNLNEMYQIYLNSFRNYIDGKLKKNITLEINVLFDVMSIKYKGLDGNLTIVLEFWKGVEKILPGHFLIIYSKSFQFYRYSGEPFKNRARRKH